MHAVCFGVHLLLLNLANNAVALTRKNVSHKSMRVVTNIRLVD